jgi:hypothetical protein
MAKRRTSNVPSNILQAGGDMPDFARNSNITRTELLSSSALPHVPDEGSLTQNVPLTYKAAMEQKAARAAFKTLFSGRSLLDAIADHGGVATEIHYFQGWSGYERLSLLHHTMWMRENIASLVVTFGGVAGALSFLRSTTDILHSWIRRGRRITIRTDHLSLDIHGSDDLQMAINAFQELNAAQHRVTTTLGDQPMRILFLAANPTTTSSLDLEEELRSLQTELRGVKYRDQIALTAQHAVRPDDLVRYVRSERPTIVHFSGHGSGTGIIFRNEEGGHTEVTGASLQRFFLNREVRLVVLNACYTQEQAKLLPGAVAAVVGTTDSVGDVAARRFTVAFYRALGDGYSIREAFRDGTDAVALDNKEDVFWSDGKLDQLLVIPPNS